MNETPEVKENAVPRGTVWTMEIKLASGQNAVFYLKDITEDLYYAGRALIQKGKTLDAARMMLKAMRLGGDEVSLLDNDLRAATAAANQLAEIMEPAESSLKKS